MAELGLWNFWIYIIVNGLVLLYVMVKKLHERFFDKRAFVYIFFADRQVGERRVHIINNSVTVYFKAEKEHRTYTVNEKNLFYFGHVAVVMVWDNNPLSLRFKKDVSGLIDKDESEVLFKTLAKLHTDMSPVPPPLTLLQSDLEPQLKIKTDKETGKQSNKTEEEINKEDKQFAVLSATELWAMAHTNLTMGIWNRQDSNLKQVWDSTKWLIVAGVVIVAILHMTGQIDVFEMLGTVNPKQ